MMYELVQPNDDSPSVFQEVVARRGYGFHHVAMATDTFDETVGRFIDKGYGVALEARSPEADGGGRVVYLDPVETLPGMLEIMELDPDFESALQQLHEFSRTWDGQDPVRVMTRATARSHDSGRSPTRCTERLVRRRNGGFR